MMKKLSISLFLLTLFLSCTENTEYRYIEYGPITNFEHKGEYYIITVGNVTITVPEENVNKIGEGKLKLYE